MTFQAYLDTVKAKTGKTPADFETLADKQGLVNYPEILAWLKSDFGLGHGHANAVVQVMLHADDPKESNDEGIAKHFVGARAHWRTAYDGLIDTVQKFGPDTSTTPTSSYISVLRGGKKFAIVQVTADRLVIGIKLKDRAAAGRFAESGKWNAMVTHRVQIDDPKQIDAELFNWLHQAYDKA